MKGLGKVLRDKATALGLSDSEVARRLGLSQARYHNYVVEVTEPDLATFVRICRTLCVSPNEALGYEGQVSAPTGDDLSRERVYSAIQAIEGDALAFTADMLEAVVSTRLKTTRKPTTTRRRKPEAS